MRLSPVLVVAALVMCGPGLGTALGASGPGQTAQTAVTATPPDAAAHDQASPAKEHDHAAMLAAQAAAQKTTAPSEIDLLVKKMNSARGQAKVAIMADLITKLVAERQQAAGSGHTAAAGGSTCCGGHGASASDGARDMSCPMCAAHMKTEAQK